jgi:hypothetical protein
MRVETTDFIEGTAFDKFQKEYDVKLLTIKIQCPKCGHIWGVKIDDYSKTVDIPARKFACVECKL